jgi:hypothetical protein
VGCCCCLWDTTSKPQLHGTSICFASGSHVRQTGFRNVRQPNMWQTRHLLQPTACSSSLHPTSSAANFSTAVKGASSGTLNLQMSTSDIVSNSSRLASASPRGSTAYTLNGSLGSDVRVILNVTFDLRDICDSFNEGFSSICSKQRWLDV